MCDKTKKKKKKKRKVAKFYRINVNAKMELRISFLQVHNTTRTRTQWLNLSFVSTKPSAAGYNAIKYYFYYIRRYINTYIHL